MKSLKDCPYFKIKQLDAHIEREKQMLTYVQAEVMQYEEALTQSDIKQLMALEKICYDSFSWPNSVVENRDLEGLVATEKQDSSRKKKIKCEQCSYDRKTCQDVLAFKKSRIVFLRQKIREANGYHNQLVDLAHVACCKLGSLKNPEQNGFIVFYKQALPSLVYFNKADFKPLQEGRYTYDLIYYDEKKLQLQKKELSYVYEVCSKALEGTYLGDGNQAMKFIKVEFPEDKTEAVEEAILNGLYILTKKLNQQFKRRYGPIQGLYIEMPQVLKEAQRTFKKRIEKLGYQTLGKVNEQGVFEKERLLVYLWKFSG